VKALHLFAGIGGGALGFQRAGFETVGAVDFDAGACRDFEQLVARPCTHADLETMTPAELAAACTDRPDVVFTSPPCKGFSRCQSAAKAKTEKYQRMNALTLRGIWLALEAWPVPPALIVMENVPAILSRGREWLEKIEALLRGYGYATSRSTHDCGELGGLAQHRRRFLLVARHVEQVPALLRVPPTKRVRGIGEVLGELPCPVPGSTEGGPMHRLPKLSAMNWVRLALIPAGKDWRALPEQVLLTERPARQNGVFGVSDWDAASHGVLGHHEVRSTWGSVADPRVTSDRYPNALGVLGGDAPSLTIRGMSRSQTEAIHVADPRVQCKRREGGHGVKAWTDASTAVIGHPIIDNFPAQVADPRCGHENRRGTWHVHGWAEPSHTVRAQQSVRNGSDAAADPRVPEIEGPRFDIASMKPIHLVIVAADGTWHRPLTTLELAALQGFPVRMADGSWLVLGGSKAEQREHIGNAVPPPAAEAIAMQCRATLLAAAAGGFMLSSAAIWVRREEALAA
jgi:site-specific DNA-cytosine methylase